MSLEACPTTRPGGMPSGSGRKSEPVNRSHSNQQGRWVRAELERPRRRRFRFEIRSMSNLFYSEVIYITSRVAHAL